MCFERCTVSLATEQGANNGTITIGPGSRLIFNGNLGGTGNILINGGALEVTVSPNNNVDSNGTNLSDNVSFASGTVGTFQLDALNVFTGTLSGLAPGDAIDFANAIVTSATVNGNGFTVTFAGGQTENINLATPGTWFTLQLDGNGGDELVVTSSPSSSAATGGQTLEIISGQIGSGITVLSGGTLQVDSGGITSDATISGGGIENISSGGTALDAIVSSGGMLAVQSGGLADPATIYAGGTEFVSGGGTDLGAQVSGGTQINYGYASGAVVYAGSQIIEAGGSTLSTTVSGGTELILSGGVASGTIVSSGGTSGPSALAAFRLITNGTQSESELAGRSVSRHAGCGQYRRRPDDTSPRGRFRSSSVGP